jgi:hypothetical protein
MVVETKDAGDSLWNFAVLGTWFYSPIKQVG